MLSKPPSKGQAGLPEGKTMAAGAARPFFTMR